MVYRALPRQRFRGRSAGAGHLEEAMQKGQRQKQAQADYQGVVSTRSGRTHRSRHRRYEQGRSDGRKQQHAGRQPGKALAKLQQQQAGITHEWTIND